MKIFSKLLLLMPMSLALLGVPVLAQDSVIGEGRAPMGAGTPAAIRGAAKQEAVRDATLKAIKDATALDASADKFSGIVTEIAKQVRNTKMLSEDAVGNEFVTRVELSVDRKQIKNAIRGTELDKLNDRSFTIMLLMDEFVVSTRDLNLPLEELVEMKYDAGSSFKDKSVRASSSSAAASSAVAYSGKLDASSSSANKFSGSAQRSGAAQSGDTSIAVASRVDVDSNNKSSASVHAKEDFAAAASSKSASAKVDAKNIEAASHETASYKKLVKWQDNSRPSSNPMFLNAFSGNLRDYDIRMLDATVAKSTFFKDKPLTLAVLSNGAQMKQFNDFARTKANADFLLMGSATVIAGEKNASGAMGCVVNVEMKVFATAGAEVIAGTADSTQASGANIEACTGNAVAKMARMLAPVLTSRVLGYWADRAARGRQYTVSLKGANMTLPMRISFAKALRGIDGAADVEKKEDGPDGVKVTLTLKGKADAMEEVVGALSNQAAFSNKNLDAVVEGEMVTICLTKCAAEPKSKKK
jgi:hypothetical protein